MKCRNDFVTNSSSSSFLIGFKNKDEGIDTISKMVEDFGSRYINQLLSDFIDAESFSKESMKEIFYHDLKSIATWDLDTTWEGWHFAESDFQKNWLNNHPGASFKDYFQSEERANKIQELVEDELIKLRKLIEDCGYLVKLEYEDHDKVGSELEHYILPNQPFVKKIFSHH